MTARLVTMRIEGMHCPDCGARVARALTDAGARDVRVDWRAGRATFTAEESLPLERLASAVAQAGYRPGPVEAPQPAPAPQGPPAMGVGEAPYDLAIIGAGAAAFAAAIRARELGARVVMVEAGTLGGTCVNVGCVPSKFLLRAAEIFWQAGHHPFAGVRTQALGVDLGALSAQKQRLLDHLRQEKYADLIPAYGWEFRQGTATFADPETLLVDGRPLRARAYLIATGASPAIPPIPGLAEARYLTSTTALDLTALPRSLAVIGGNAIGLELGQAFRRLGSRVVLFELLPRIAPFEEPEISQTLAEALGAEGMEIVTAAQVGRVERLPDGQRQVTATVSGQTRTWTVGAVLVATGRRPNTAGLGLERAGIQTDRRGAVVVDETLRTTNPRVWAAGDVAGAPQFVYVAAYEGTLAAENSLTGAGRRVDFTALPRVTFTSPQIAAVGPTEAEARAQGQTVRTALLPLQVLSRARVNGETRGLFKLLADARTGRLLGAHILAENAGEVIYAAVLAIKAGLTIDDLVASFAPYLTMAEGLRLAAQAFSRDVARLSCCA